MSKKDDSHDQRIYDLAEKALQDLHWVAPEDRGMRRTKIGNVLMTATDPLRQIHRVLDGKVWDSGTLDEVARILRAAGFTVKEPE